MQASLDSDDSLRHSVVGDEQIGVLRQSDEAVTLAISVAAKHDYFAADLYTPRQCRDWSMDNAHCRGRKIAGVKYSYGC